MDKRELVIWDSDLITKPDLSAWGLDSREVMKYAAKSVLPDLGERNRVYYILSLTAGGLQYQYELLKKNSSVAQWILLIRQNQRAPIWAFERQLESLKSSIHMIRTVGKSDSQIKEELRSIALIRERSCLVYSKRSGIGKKTAVELLQKKLCPDWEFEICEGPEEKFRECCAGMSRVLIMGCSIQDFSLSKPEQMKTPPIFLYHRCDEQVQTCLRPDILWERIRDVLSAREWEFSSHYSDFYVGSAPYENWALEMEAGGGVHSLALSDSFVMWDNFGLPLLREQYTDQNIRDFLSDFHSFRDIRNHLQAV